MESKSAVLAAISELRKKIKGVRKERKQGLNYEIVSYDALVDSIQDETVELGLALTPVDCTLTNQLTYEVTRKNGGTAHMKCESFIFKFKLYHTSGEYIDVVVPSIGLDDSDHGPSKAVTYAARSAWMTVLMLKRGKDYDTDSSDDQPEERLPAQSHGYRQEPDRQPSQQTPSYTADPSTWPDKIRQFYASVMSEVKDQNALEEHEGPNWVAQIHALVGELKERQCPIDIVKPFVANVTVHLLNTLLKTRHAIESGELARKHFDQLTKFVGPQIAEMIKAKLPQ